jgi:AAA domain
MSESEIEQPKAATFERRELLLDVKSLEIRTVDYPEDVRDAVQRIAGFLRRRCNSQPKLLADKTKKLGFPTVDTNFSKILKGYLYINGNTGEKLDSPVVREKTIVQIADALAAEEARLERGGRLPFIEVETWHDIRNKIDEIRAPGSVAKYALIWGPTGRSKTESCKHYVRLDGHRTVHHIECPAKPNRGEFLKGIAEQFSNRCAGNTAQLRAQIASMVNETACLILDNFQRMYISTKGWDQDIWSDIQKLQEDTDCAIVMVVSVEFTARMRNALREGYLEQFTGRCGGAHEFLEVREYLSLDDARTVCAAIKLPEKHAAELQQIASLAGRDRVLYNVIQKAQRRAAARKKPLSIDHLREVLGPAAAELKEAA